MNKTSFWTKLKKPILVLAPMADVTDCAFRTIIQKYGKPDVFWTEFVSADGLAHPEARAKLLIDLKFNKYEHPIVAQIFGGNIQNLREAGKLCKELGFDGVDINMGCPDKSIERQGAGASCMKNPIKAREYIRAVREGSENLPVSVKTRLGYNKLDFEWIREILKEKPEVLTVHLRTRKEMSKVPAHWILMSEIIKIRNEVSPETLILGNGDVVDTNDARRKCLEYGCDGVMLGRAIFGNPWLFKGKVPSLEEKLKVMIEHTKLFEEMLGQYKNFAIMKKHFKAYVNNFEGAKELRMELMEAENAKQVEEKVTNFLQIKK